MSVHYKFKSSLDYDTVTFDGLHISVTDLKKAIIQQKKIGKSSDFDLQITNAQTKEVYKEDDTLIPKNSSVIVARIPIPGASKKTWERNDASSPLLSAKSSDSPSDSLSFDKLTKTADLTSINASEDDKIKAMMTQATQDYDPSKYIKVKGMAGPIPSTYLCYRCGKPGHWIKNCPTNNNEVKRSTGIPRSFMVAVEGPDVPGALLTNTGHFAVPVIDHEAYKEGKKERPPFAKEPTPEKEEKPVIPEELLCMICRDLLSDAVLIPCCGNSYCDECVRQALLDSDEHECPTCHEKDISPDTLIPNRFLRTAVMNFKNETGYTKIKKLVKSLTNLPEPSSPKMTPPQSSLTPPQQIINEPIKTETKSQVNTEKIISPLQVATTTTAEQSSNNDENMTDDRPGTPVRDEKPVSSPLGVIPLQRLSTTVPKQEKPIPTASMGVATVVKPLIQHPQKLEGKQAGYTIATITTRQRVPFSHIHPSPYVTKRPRNGTTAGAHSRGSHQQSITYSPKREHHYSHHTNSSHGTYTQPSPLFNPLLPLQSHGSGVPHLHGPPAHLGPPQTSGTHHPFSATQVPPARIMPPRGPILPGYPPQPPPPGSIPLNSTHYDQPPPPGIPLPVPSHSAQHHGNYDYYREHKDRTKDALDDFERELMEYKFVRQNSRSTSRSYMSSRSSSRSRSHSVSRSVSHSSRSHSRSRSYSYSRSRSSSLSRSRSRSRSRSHSYRRSRTRSRSRGRHYSPAYRRSRSRSPYNKSRSPFRRGYSPSYYNPAYRYQAPISSTYSPDNRSRFYHQPYRYDDYQYGDQRYDSHDHHYNPRYEYGHYEDVYRDHDKHRSWTPEGREKDRRESRKGRTQELLKKEDRIRSPFTHKDKENDKKSQKRHHKSKNKKEKDQDSYYHKDKIHRDESQKIESEEFVEENKTSEKYDLHGKYHGSRKIDRHPESDIDAKSKDRKHKVKIKKLQEQVKVKNKNGKTSEEDNSDAREIVVQTPATKISSKRILRYKHHRRTSGSEDMGRETDTHKVNPNIIVIKTDPDLKTKVMKENKDNNEKIIDNQNNIISERENDMKKEIVQTEQIEQLQERTVEVKVQEEEEEEEEETEIAPDKMESHNDGEQEISSEIVDEKTTEELKKETVIEEEEMEDDEEEEIEDEEQEIEQELEQELENEQEQEQEDVIEEVPGEPGEPVLTAQIPELSKWERDDSELDESVSPEREAKYPSPKVLKSLPPDIVERAEKAILHKPVKPTIVNSSGEKTSTVKANDKKIKTYEKISPKIKTVQSSDVREVKPDVATLQITISGKDKRSVEAKDSSNVREKKDYDDLKNKSKIKDKIKLDRSKFHSKHMYEDLMNYRSVKVRSSRSKVHTPDRDSFSLGKKELSSQENKILKMELSRNKGFDIEMKQNKYKGSPKREKIFEDRERKMKQYDRESFRNIKQGSNDRMLFGFQSEQKRKDGQRLVNDDYKRKNNDEGNERNKGKGRSEKEKSRESPDRRQDNSEYQYKMEKDRYQSDKEKSERHDRKRNSKDILSKKLNKNSNKERHATSDSETEETKHLSEDRERKSYKNPSDDHQFSPSFQENNQVSKAFQELERSLLTPSKTKPSISHEQYISKHRDRRKSTIDESKFEPNYDESSESDSDVVQESAPSEIKDVKMKRSSSQSPERLSKKVKKEKPTVSDSEAIFTHSKLVGSNKSDFQQEHFDKMKEKSDSSSSSSSESGSASPTPVQSDTLSPKKKMDIGQPMAQVVKEKYKHKKSKHKKHKKHKHKHKKKKAHHKNKHKDDSKEGKVKSSIAKN